MSRRIVIAGASGLIGGALQQMALARGDRVTTLVRRPVRRSDEVQWDPARQMLHPRHIEGADAVIVLNGVTVGKMPWTKNYRHRLLASRLEATRTIVSAVQRLGTGAPALISASAVGYYGSRPGEVLTESSGPGDTFLANLCIQWEAAARQAEEVTRVALIRTAPVIHRHGVLRPMITLTSLGLGGPLGAGTQVWPWVSLPDEARAILHVVDAGISGPVNVCGPTPATANSTGRALARELRRPFWLPAPAWGLELLLGTDATASLLTADAEVQPEVLIRSGFTFTHSTVESAMRAAIAGEG